jgi:hypothetical protein
MQSINATILWRLKIKVFTLLTLLLVGLIFHIANFITCRPYFKWKPLAVSLQTSSSWKWYNYRVTAVSTASLNGEQKITVFWNVASCSLVELDRRFTDVIALKMKAVSTSETSVKLYQTTRGNARSQSAEHLPPWEPEISPGDQQFPT